ncbi:Hypothetical predicted protein [Cloeon dipterum]|uniref:NodB homology domain-containing protein n=1 Tax=Cloeon dipterum TaxID=197152 RepID=A0A8S1CNM0_9INSE|nr:Hypothetical predicted protein [Cloeon dipterum]
MKLVYLLMLGLAGANCARIQSRVAEDCNPDICNNQNCRCFNPGVTPGGLSPQDIPQIVLVTFDDAVTSLLYSNYYSDAFANRQNPNGCPVGATFFMSHEYSDYESVNKLWNSGHEIALHSITHTSSPDYWTQATPDDLAKEFNDQRDMIAHFANIPASEISGLRTPFLLLGGDSTFQMITNNNFLYDCSWPTQSFVGKGLYPYSLDYKSNQDCNVGVCPTESHPGAWVLPMVDWIGANGYACAMVDTCVSGATGANELLEFIKTNFHRHYDNYREPFGFYVHAAWFNTNSTNYEAFKMFLDYVGTLNDAYVVTAKQAIEWTRNPTNTGGAANTFGCPAKEPAACNKRTCNLQKPGEGERIMVSCVDCPPNYPWLGNPLGQ